MALSDLWIASPQQLTDKHVKQVISFSGTGKLGDGNDASNEFREFLSKVPSTFLARYSDECLRESFEASGFALQDVVNQIGRRLGFTVTHGRYRGTTGQIGFDGLWRFPDGHTAVVEVKTTDAYRIDLNSIAGYWQALISQNQLQENKSSILIVVGRQDTGDLEAQIRGSKHAWDVRLISVDSLLRLMALKEELEDPRTLARIHDLLFPTEFTRLDSIVELAFSAAEDARPEEEEVEGEESEEPTGSKKFTPVNFHAACITRIQQHLGVELIRISRASFSSPDQMTAVVCAISRE